MSEKTVAFPSYRTFVSEKKIHEYDILFKNSNLNEKIKIFPCKHI